MQKIRAALVAGALGAFAMAAQARTVSFSTPGAATWTVPAGVTSVQIAATGAGGGSGDAGGTAGNGGIVTVTLPVVGGQLLNLVVGGGGPTVGSSSGGGAAEAWALPAA